MASSSPRPRTTARNRTGTEVPQATGSDPQNWVALIYRILTEAGRIRRRVLLGFALFTSAIVLAGTGIWLLNIHAVQVGPVNVERQIVPSLPE